MWNNLMEKAKTMAADIDQQLNEAVGADATAEVLAKKNTSAMTTSAATTTPQTSTSTAAAFGGLMAGIATAVPKDAATADVDADDVWNDDFDFGDDNDEVDNNKKGAATEEPTDVAASTPQNDNEAHPGADVFVKMPNAETARPDDVELPEDQLPEEDALEEAPNDSVPPAIEDGMSDEDPDRSKTTEPQGLISDDDAPSPPFSAKGNEPADPPTDIPDASASASNGPSTDTASIAKAAVATAEIPSDETKMKAEHVQQQSAATQDVCASVDVDFQESSSPADGGWDDFDPIDVSSTNREDDDNEFPQSAAGPAKPASPPSSTAATVEPDSLPQAAESLAAASKMMFSTFAGRHAPSKDEEEGEEEGNKNNSNGGSGLFSNLAHRAEGGVTSLLHAAAHLVDADNDENTVEEDESVVAGRPTSSLPSIFSTAVDTVSSAQNTTKGNDCEENDDLDITENDGVDESSTPVVHPKDEGSKTAVPSVTLNDGPSDILPQIYTSENSSAILQKDEAIEQAGPEQSDEAPSMNSLNEAASSFVQVSPLSTSPLNETSTIEEELKEKADVPTITNNHSTGNIEDDPRFKELTQALRQREEQLANKAMQLTELQNMMESQEQDYKRKLQDTKEEAKNRILRAKERCEAVETKLRLQSSAGIEDVAKQEQIIAALRSEGAALAMKQSAMEQAVRAAKGETRELREQLIDEAILKENALQRMMELEAELKLTKESLSAARRGESQAGKLENDLLSARSDAESKANTILSLQQHIKELTSESKELKDEIAKIQKSAAHEAQQEKTNMRREHNDLLTDLETKLRTTEKEAGVREDALRHEVAEMRKRWQDAVRRADVLSMDIQSSTAPLLRQLESMERQTRARAANWAELESRLRSELEESVIQNENLTKDRTDFKAKFTRFERMAKEREEELTAARKTIEEQAVTIVKLESQLTKLSEEAEKRQEEYEKVERLASEGVAKVRSEMSQTVIESEERYRGQIDKLETDLKMESEKRSQLENQVDQLLENAGMIVSGTQAPEGMRRESKPKKLRQAEGQAEILAGALGVDISDDESDDESDGDQSQEGAAAHDSTKKRSSVNSYAALEQLTSKVKNAQAELSSLKKSLRESELIRESLVEELGETRHAKEKLPLFEANVKQLTEENREKELEIMGLREDISEVKEMYRAQLNLLVEEKIANEQQPQQSLNNGDDAKLVGDGDVVDAEEDPADDWSSH